MYIIAAIALTLGAVWFALCGPIAVGSVSIYVVMYGVTLASACAYAVRSQQRDNIIFAIAFIVHFILHTTVWQYTQSYFYLSVLYAFFAGLFLATGKTSWQYFICGLFILAAAAGVLARFGVVPSHMEREFLFIDWSYPDIIAIIGHAANVCLGHNSDEDYTGRRELDGFATRLSGLGNAGGVTNLHGELAYNKSRSHQTEEGGVKR